MNCKYCKDENSLLSGEDWRVFIRGNEMICSIGSDEHDHKKVNICPMCGRPLTEPQPLTLDQLKQMGGEPVYIRLGDGDQFWSIVAVDNGELGLLGECYDHECPDEAFYGMVHNDPAGHFGLHVLGWLAYDRKPERDGE